MRSRWWLLASLILVIEPRWAAAEDAKRIESDKVAKIAATLVAATSGLSDLPVKVTADTQRAMGVTGQDRGGVLVPDSRLTAEALKKVDKDVLPIGLLFLHRITLSVAEQATPADQHRQITVTVEDETVNVFVLPLAVTRVADRLVLLVYTNRKEPAVVTTLVDFNESKDLPLEMEARPAQDQRATLLFSILGRYRAAADVVAQD
ncbi:MAG TPA: hypothetical protein VK137_21040 [Planctomycetaceae bacterium]|nr:hypothetical protein [Planctomycetaceae bacterium]